LSQFPLALERLREGVHIYNLGTGKGTSELELIKTFADGNGPNLNYD